MVEEPKRDHILSTKMYDVLKPITTTVLPGLTALYVALGAIWGLPAVDQVVGTVAAVNVFLGLLLQLATASYNNSDSKYAGTLNVIETPEKKTYQLDVTGNPEALEKSGPVQFKVNKNGY
jgi:hypothetical protein